MSSRRPDHPHASDDAPSADTSASEAAMLRGATPPEQAPPPAPPPSTPPPPADDEVSASLTEALRAMYDSVVDEALPASFADLIARLDDSDA